MSTIMPTDRNVRLAIAWIEDHKNTHASLQKCIQEGSQRFNLSPLEGQILQRFYHEELALCIKDSL